jgi:hypothetical protein
MYVEKNCHKTQLVDDYRLYVFVNKLLIDIGTRKHLQVGECEWSRNQ